VLVTLNGVAARTPDGRGLFDNLTLAFGRERTAVVGRNGVGKSNLFDAIRFLSLSDQGDNRIHAALNLGIPLYGKDVRGAFDGLSCCR
jgi:ATPase subunit of ABC transporter with duplicated ATPase domains